MIWNDELEFEPATGQTHVFQTAGLAQVARHGSARIDTRGETDTADNIRASTKGARTLDVMVNQ